jgi:TPR repeat protein
VTPLAFILRPLALGLAVAALSGAPAWAQSDERVAAETDWLRSQAESGTAEAQMILFDQALQGSAEAQYAVALLYAGGTAMPRDMRQARRWYGAAAAQGHKAALSGLRHLASEGDGAAFYELGVLSRDGLGVPRDPEAARQAFKWAGETGHPLALFAAGEMFLNGIGGGVDADAARARFAAVGCGADADTEPEADVDRARLRARYRIGLCYLTGQGGLEANAVEAARWLRAAAESGFAPAQRELGLLYRQGRGVPRDGEREFYWLERAAAGGSEEGEKDK